MDSQDSEVNSIDEESSSLINEFESCYSNLDKKFDSDSNDFDENEDTRSELKFDEALETEEEKLKRSRIEEALVDPKSNLETWRRLALDKHGLVNDDLRRKVWPLLLEVDPNPGEKAPVLSDLADHKEYHQVVLDVNRSLKRFPPGIPYKQRLALQDQLTVLILRVIIKYPHLRYYQGYHDVAITFLLVVGEAVAFRIMDRLSTDHLRECMEPTMERTSYRLNYMYPLLHKADPKLHDFMERATVGTMFALPWYLTWFGHSLNQYRDVVRLYDYFLATPPLMPLYVATAVVMHRRAEVFEAGCDMASVHCTLSQIPDDLDFELILKKASELHAKYPPQKLEREVKRRVEKEKNQRRLEELRIRRQRNKNKPVWNRLGDFVPIWLMLNYRGKYGLIVATATVLFGLYAYLKASESNGPMFRKDREYLTVNDTSISESVVAAAVLQRILIYLCNLRAKVEHLLGFRVSRDVDLYKRRLSVGDYFRKH